MAAAALDPESDKSSSGEMARLSEATAAELEAAGAEDGESFEYKALFHALLAFSKAPLSWPSELTVSSSIDIWREITMERWFRHMTTATGVFFPLLLCSSTARVPVADAYKQLVAKGLHGTAGDSSASHVLLLVELRGRHTCDCTCLLRCATSFVALALHAAHSWDERDVARYLDAAQEMFLTAGFRLFSEALEAEQGPTLSALWGLLTALWGTSFMRSLWPSEEMAVSMSDMFPKVFGYPLPEKIFACPKASALAPLPPAMALNLYQMVETVGRVLSWHGVVWFASHGTLLGAVRHQGIIPHDCDADFSVTEDSAKLLVSAAVMDSLLRNGYEVAFRPVQNLFAIFRLGSHTEPAGWSPQGYTSTEPHMDIYVLRHSGLAGNEFLNYLSNPLIHPTFSVPEWALLPTGVMPFGASTVRVPAHPDIYLNSMYGHDWPKMVRSMASNINVTAFAALELDAYPSKMAMPAGPLRWVELPVHKTPNAMDASVPDVRQHQ